MAIRLRIVDGILIAICAAMSIEKEGDIYIDDGQHYALATKFMEDWKEDLNKLSGGDPVLVKLMEQEQSNNAGGDWWDRTYGDKT